MTPSIEQFIKRNQKRNAKLYDSTCIEGQDYIVCPVSKERLSMIKSNYITQVLNMSVDAYDQLYPGVRGVSLKRKLNIKTGLKQIDTVTGLTKYEVGQVKARQILSTVDSTGMSGYDRKGQKTKATHMANIDELGRNGYRRQADARLTTVLDNGLTVEQNAHIKQRATMLKTFSTGTGGASKVSKRVLQPIIEYLESINIDFLFDNREYVIKDCESGNYYFFDLTIIPFGITIEYQSNAWHADPRWPTEKWNAWTPPRGEKKLANDVLAYDYAKAKALYENRNILTYYVWEDSATADVQEILCLLKTLNTKYSPPTGGKTLTELEQLDLNRLEQ